MASLPGASSIIRFGAFELDAVNGELRKAGVSLKIHPQPLQVLLLLAQHAGQIVTREEIQRSLWGDNTFVDFERGINFSINQIRAALGDDAEKPRYVETLPRRGYRFVAPVKVEACAAVDDHTSKRIADQNFRPVGVPAGEARALPDSGDGVPTRKRGYLLAALALGAATVATVVVGVNWWHAKHPVLRPLIRMGVELLSGPDMNTYRIDETILAKREPGPFLALSPDGGSLAITIRDADGIVRLATRRLDENQFKVLPGTENPAAPFFSPDGQWIGFFGDGKLRKIPVQGGAPVLLCESDVFSSGSWGDDGNIIASLSPWKGLVRVSSAGGAPTPVTELKKGEIWHSWPQVLPGSGSVVFTASTGGGPEGRRIEILSFKTHERKTLVRGGVMGRYVAASNGNGYLVYLHQNSLLAARFDISTLTVSGPAQSILDDVTPASPSSPGDFDVARNGTFVYISGKGEPARAIFWLDRNGKTSPLHPAPGFYDGLRFSPDGKHLVFAAGDVFGHADLWAQDLDRNTMSRITSLSGSSMSPIWSPDGKYILFWVGQQPNAGLYRVRSDGAGEPQRVGEPEMGWPSSFSADGKRLLLQRGNPFDTVEVWTAAVEGGSDHLLVGKKDVFLRARGFVMPTFSPDSRWLAYSSSETGTAEIYVQPFPGSGEKVPISTGGGQFPLWSPNRHELFFCGSDHRIMVIEYKARGDSFLPGKPRVWSPRQIPFNAANGPFQPYALAPDGKRFAVTLYTDGTTEQHNALHLTFLLNFTDELRRRVPTE